MRRLGILLAALAAAVSAGPAAPDTRVAAKTCRPGFTHAVIAGQHRCLRAGQRCLRRHDRRYHRYRFHCHSGRLTRRQPAPAPPLPPAATVTVEASGFKVRDSLSMRQVAYGVVLRNSSRAQDAIGVSITVSALDAANAVLRSDRTTITGIPADSRYYFGGVMLVDLTRTPVRLETTVRVSSLGTEALVSPVVENARVSGGGESTEIVGEIHNPNTRELSASARVTGVAFGTTGRVIGGGAGVPDGPVAARGRQGFRIALSAFAPGEVASARVSVEPQLAGL